MKSSSAAAPLPESASDNVIWRGNTAKASPLTAATVRANAARGGSGRPNRAPYTAGSSVMTVRDFSAATTGAGRPRSAVGPATGRGSASSWASARAPVAPPSPELVPYRAPRTRPKKRVRCRHGLRYGRSSRQRAGGVRARERLSSTSAGTPHLGTRR